MEAAFAAYEADLFVRAEASATDSAAGLAMCFNDEAPDSLVDFFNRLGARQVSKAA